MAGEVSTDDELLAFLDAGPPVPASKSAVDKILSCYGERGRTILISALSNPTWPTTAIRKALCDSGHKVSESSLRRYRKERFNI